MIRLSLHTIRGFTLVELMVTMAIFTGVVTIATGALFSAQAINVRLQQTQIILDEASVASELMVRDIRYGTVFYCTNSEPGPTAQISRLSCPIGGTVLFFRPAVILSGSTNQANDRVAYYVKDGALYKNEYPSGGVMRALRVTSSSLAITDLNFIVKGAEAKANYDLNQPVITISLVGLTVPSKPSTPPVSFNMQTTASSREIDN